MTDLDDAVSRYVELRPLYEAYSSKVVHLVRDLLEDDGISFDHLDSRAKDTVSLRAKMRGKDKEDLALVDDLAGVRVVIYYADDLTKVGALLRRQFLVHEDKCNLAEGRFEKDRFGYPGDNYVMSLRDDRAALVEWKRYKDLVCEIQVRTVLQHAWSAVSHKVAYKREAEMPAEVGRGFSRMSALFEIGDDLFIRLRDTSRQVKETYEEQIYSGGLDLKIDGTSIDAYAQSSPMSDEIEAVMNTVGIKLAESTSDGRYRRDRSDFLSVLVAEEITSLQELDRLLRSVNLEAFLHDYIEAVEDDDELTMPDVMTLIVLCTVEDPVRHTTAFYLDVVTAFFATRIKKYVR